MVRRRPAHRRLLQEPMVRPRPGAPPPAAYAQLAPGCHWGQRKVWVEGVGYQVRTVQVCP